MAPATERALPVETLYTDGHRYFIDLIRDINAARRQIDLEVYILDDDEIGRTVIAALSHAWQRGVQVRLLVDGVGLPLVDAFLLKRIEASGFPFRIYHPIPWFFRHWRHFHGGSPAFLDRFAKLNKRNHRKTCCVDGRIAWVGSYNLSAVHLPKPQGGEGWRDTAVRIEPVDTGPLQAAFDRAWSPLKPRWPRLYRHSPFRLNDSRRKRRYDAGKLLSRIRHARQRIWITNAYFVPDEAILKALNQAATRGVDVRILLPSRSDLFFMPWAASVFYRELLEHGSRIYEYQPTILHAKTLIIDDWMRVGSSNLNTRSLRHDLEVDYRLTRPATRSELARQFERDQRNAIEVRREDQRKRPLWQCWLGHLVLFARQWL